MRHSQLAQCDCSEKTVAALARYVHKQLVPDDDIVGEKANASVSTTLPHSVIESAINSIATRVNYGLDAPPTGGKIPATYYIWRWEVKPEHRNWLPKSVLDKTDTRMLERAQVRR
jgi:chromatin assembly factor 1 subunit A